MKILFLSNVIRRDGAPLRLLEIVNHLREKNPQIYMDLMVDYFEIENIYEKSINNVITTSFSLFNRYLSKMSKYFLRSGMPFEDRMILRKINKKYDIIYINTSVELKKALLIKQKLPNSKLILHLRELETVSLLNNRNFYSDVKKVDKVIAISKSVFEFAKIKCGIPEDKISLIYSGTYIQQEKKTNNIAENIIIGSVGGATHRKGVDFFILLAKKVHNTFPNINFQWVGKISDDNLYKFNVDLEKMGLSENFQFIGSNNDIMSIMKKWTLFISSAREEPLGVACIEAGSLGIPLLVFKDSGGPEEIVANGGGLLSDYLDIDGMYKNIIELIQNEDLYNLHSDIIKKNVVKYDISNALPKIQLLIEQTLDCK